MSNADQGCETSVAYVEFEGCWYRIPVECSENMAKAGLVVSRTKPVGCNLLSHLN